MSVPATSSLRALAREVRKACVGVALPEAACRSLAEGCLAHLDRLGPMGVCDVSDVLAQQAYVHEELVAALLARMDPRTVAHTPSAALRVWLRSLATLRVAVPAEHLDRCMARLNGPRQHGPAVAAMPLLRSLLLIQVTPRDAALRHATGIAGRLLSASARAPGGTGTAALPQPLSDIAWLAENEPPPWWQMPLPHHAAVLEAARVRDTQSCDMGQPHSAADPPTSGILAAVHAALERLGCHSVSGVGCGAALALPELRLSLEVVGPLEELRFAPARAEGAGGVAPALVELRRARLRALGWHVELLREAEWPTGRGEGEVTDETGTSALQRRQEVVLRQKLAMALQRQVPKRRQRWSLAGRQTDIAAE